MDSSLVAVYLNSIQIEQVSEFKDFGLLVQEKTVTSTAEVYSRIGLVSAASNGAYGGRMMSWSKQKFGFFRTRILPVLLYGSKTWTSRFK